MNLIDFIFPKTCLGCGKEGQYLCLSCVSKSNLVRQICIECEKSSIDGLTHTKCTRSWGLDGAVSVWVYEGIIRKALIKLKYKFAYELANELSRYASDFMKKNINALPKDAILTPVPLHARRQKWRGFNQAEEIGKLIAQNLGWEFRKGIVIRKNPTKPQTELKRSQRKKNILGAFSLKPNHQLLSTNYIIFDDVATTGSTLREVTKVLKRSGAKSVWGLTIAR